MTDRAAEPDALDPRGLSGFLHDQTQVYIAQRRADAVKTVSDVGEAIRGAGAGLGTTPQIKAFFDEAALGVEEFAQGIAQRSFREMADEVEAAVRRRPGVAAAALAMAGFALYHLTRRPERRPVPRSRAMVPVAGRPAPDA